MDASHYVIRYYLMAIGAMTVNVAVFWFLHDWFGVMYVVAATFAFICRSTFKFAAIRLWLFGTSIGGALYTSIGKFIQLELAGLIAGLLVLSLLVEGAGIRPLFAFLCMVTSMSVMNLLLTRRLFSPNP